jgi:hypothetical protein
MPFLGRGPGQTAIRSLTRASGASASCVYPPHRFACVHSAAWFEDAPLGRLMPQGGLFLCITTNLYEVPLPPKHRFPMRKYRLVRQGLERELTPQGFAEFETSPLVSREDLTTTHCEKYARRYVEGRVSVSENMRVGFPWSDASVRRSREAPWPQCVPCATVSMGHGCDASSSSIGTCIRWVKGHTNRR